MSNFSASNAFLSQARHSPLEPPAAYHAAVAPALGAAVCRLSLRERTCFRGAKADAHHSMTSAMDRHRTRIGLWCSATILAMACLACSTPAVSGQTLPVKSAPHDGY